MKTSGQLLTTIDAAYQRDEIALIDAILFSQWGTIRGSLQREPEESERTFRARRDAAESPNHFHHIISSIANQVLANEVQVHGVSINQWTNDWPSLLYSLVLDCVAHGTSAIGEGLVHIPRRSLQVIKKTELLAHTQVYASESALDTRIQDVWTSYSQEGAATEFKSRPRTLDSDMDLGEKLQPVSVAAKAPAVWRFPVSIGKLLLPTFKSIFRKNSLLDVAEGNNLLPILVLKLGPEIPTAKKIVSEAQRDSGRDSRAARDARERGAMVLGSDDDAEVLQGDPEFYQLAWQRVQDLEQSLYTITNAAALSTAATTHANQISGQSRSLDRYAMQLFARRVGESLKSFLETYFISLYGIRVSITGLPIDMDLESNGTTN